MKRRTQKTSIFESNDSQIQLSEELNKFFVDSFMSNLTLTRNEGNDILILKSSIIMDNLYLFLNETIDDSILKVITDTFNNSEFKELLLEDLQTYLIRESYDVSISSINYEYNDEEIKMVVACVRG